MNDQFGGGLDRILQDYERRIQKLEAAQRGGPGLQIGQASGPLFLPDSGLPSTPSGGVKMYAVGGEFRVIQDDGSVIVFPSAHVANQAPLETDVSAPASYSATWGQRVRTDLVATRAKIFELQTAARNANHQASS